MLNAVTCVARPPQPRLRPFVELVWASEGTGGPEATERMLPARAAHVVVRLDDDPVRISSVDRIDPASSVGGAVVGGPRMRPYRRTVLRKGRSVGAVLRPGATQALLGVPGAELAERHTPLEHVWASGTGKVLDRLAAIGSFDGLLDILELTFVERLAGARAPHPAVAMALARLPGSSVRDVVHESGYSHRRFSAIFKEATGLSPKRYSRLARFERTLALWRRVPAVDLSDLAHRAGYSDQPHLSREFKEFGGLTLAQYRNVAQVGSRHVPDPRAATPEVNFVQDRGRQHRREWRDEDPRGLSLPSRS